MRAIDADEVFKAAFDMACQSVLIPGCEDYAHGLREDANYIENAPTLDVAPAVEAEPVRHGRWEKGGYACGETEWKCSVCGETEWRTSCSRMKFCMFCGAKMDAGQEDDKNA